MRTHRTHRSIVVTAFAVALLGACTSSGSITSSTDPAASSTSAAAASTTVAPPTTEAPTTTAAPDPRLLRSDGIGALRFGDPAAESVSAISAELGAPVSDESRSYPTSVGGGEFLDEDGAFQFIAALSRTVCWSIGFCAVFGGGDPTTLTFTGWSYADDTSRTLSTTSGAKLGSFWSEIPSMDVNAGGGCYTYAYGSVDEVTLSVVSLGELFIDWTDEGEPIVGEPDPSEVRIEAMEAGSLPFLIFADC